LTPISQYNERRKTIRNVEDDSNNVGGQLKSRLKNLRSCWSIGLSITLNIARVFKAGLRKLGNGVTEVTIRNRYKELADELNIEVIF
jgi:hypothetical protein